MCYVHPDIVNQIRDRIAALVSHKKRFTGHDIFSKLGTYASGMHGGVSARTVSEKTRELFNAHDACFNGYACYPVPNGPLLYFYAGADVLKKGQTILDAIAATAPKSL
jgi:hypothetical protein